MSPLSSIILEATFKGENKLKNSIKINNKSSFKVVPFKEYLKTLEELSKVDCKILSGLTKNLPRNFNVVMRIYFRDGEIYPTTSWDQLSAVVVDSLSKGREINIAKTEKELYSYFPSWEKEEVVVEYLDIVKTSVQQYIENPPTPVVVEPVKVDIKLVKKNSAEMKANEFKTWLRKYLKEVGCTYEFKRSTGVGKILETLDKYVF